MLATTLVADERFEWLTEPALELSELQFLQWSSLLEGRAGITLAPYRRQFLLSNLRMRMRATGFTGLDEYYRYVANEQQGRIEWSRLIDKLTVHETCFNRHPASLRLIEKQFLPAYTSSVEVPRKLQAWSVGCATGEEAYTLAMTMERFIRRRNLPIYYSVMATDISRESLAYAREGRYPAERLAGLDESQIALGFEKLDDGFRVREKIRQRVCFSELNVMQLSEAPFGPMDIIFCQNLLIYFAQEQRKLITQALLEFLNPGGLLVLGIGEMATWQHTSLQRVKFEDTLAYQKVKD